MLDARLEGKVIVITGASSGFGKGAAREFASHGATVVLAARREYLLDDLARECEALGGQGLALPTDVSRREDVERLGDAAVSTFGRIDVWVNDAGAGALGRFEEVPLIDHVQVVQSDLIGTMYGCHVAMRQFRRQGNGTIINIASDLGEVPAPYYASYMAAKYGVVGLSRALRKELREHKVGGIHVCTVLPMDTPLIDHAAKAAGREAKSIPPLHDPQRAIDVIVRLAMDPEDEVVVGGAGGVAGLMHTLAPGLGGGFKGRQMHETQIDNARPAPSTPGAARYPSDASTEVRAGRMERGRGGRERPAGR